MYTCSDATICVCGDFISHGHFVKKFHVKHRMRHNVFIMITELKKSFSGHNMMFLYECIFRILFL